MYLIAWSRCRTCTATVGLEADHRPPNRGDSLDNRHDGQQALHGDDYIALTNKQVEHDNNIYHQTNIVNQAELDA
jgi:hypothetical protein